MGDLPAELTSFVGRTRDAEDTRNLILHGAERLVTLIGIGGCGKTRLALHVAANLRGSFRDGVYLVELAPVSDSRLVVQATLAVFGVAESSARPPQSGPRWRSSSSRIELAIQVPTCTPLVTC